MTVNFFLSSTLPMVRKIMPRSEPWVAKRKAWLLGMAGMYQRKLVTFGGSVNSHTGVPKPTKSYWLRAPTPRSWIWAKSHWPLAAFTPFHMASATSLVLPVKEKYTTMLFIYLHLQEYLPSPEARLRPDTPNGPR